MKKKFLFTVALFIGMFAVAQRMDKSMNSPGFNFQKKLPVPSKPAKKRNIVPGESNQLILQDDIKASTTLTIHESCGSVSFDPTWAARFQAVLDSIRVTTAMKGAALAVLVPGQGLFTCTSGYSSPGVPVTTAMRFGIMSNTKLFIAVTMEKLQEQGILSLEDHLYEWLPTFPHVDSTTTLRQLLSHQSGIYDFWNDSDTLWNLMLADTGRFWTPVEILATIGEPHFAPGHGYRYSNTNYLLAGMVIESATGITWAQKLHDVILTPLVMDSTFVGAFESRNGPVAAEYFGTVPVINSPVTAEYTQVDAAGALLSTSQEMAEWYSALFSGEVISGSSLQEITGFEPTSFYGLGLAEGIFYNHMSYNHTGGGVGYASLAWYDVQTKATLCMLMNDRNGDFNTRVLPLLKVLYFDWPKKPDDAGISSIISPWGNSNTASRIPSVMLTNFGSDPLTSVNIHYKVDNGIPSVFPWTGSLNPGDTIIVFLPQISGDNGFHTFTTYTALPNGVPEGNTYNDTTISNFINNTVPSVMTEIYESFEEYEFPPPGWSESSSSMFQWGKTPLASRTGTGCAVKCNYSDEAIGFHYDLEMPLLHVDAGTNPEFSFDYAYAMYPGYYGDSLQVTASHDGGITWDILFNKGGFGLNTTTPTFFPFYPQTSAEWTHESFQLAGIPGDVLLRFRAVCGFSNNLYLDDVKVSFPTGIFSSRSLAKLMAYPNPAFNEIHISGLPLNSEIRLTDLTGKVVMTQTMLSTPGTIDIHMLPRGVYVLRSTEGVMKIVKM